MSPRSRSALTACLLAAPVGAQFAPPTTIPAEASPRGAAFVDVDQDGDLDLVVSASSADLVDLYTNDGSGAFAAAQSVLTGAGSEPTAVTAADLDGDGRDELLVTLTGADAVLRIDTSGGLLSAGTSTPTGAGPADVVTLDFDGDGDLDAATADVTGGTLTLLENLGAGTFTSSTLAAGALPSGLAVGDLDADLDLDLDLALGDAANGRVDVFVNDGAGGFTPGTPVALNGALQPADVVSFDLDIDGNDDLLVSASDGTRHVVALFRQPSPGALAGSTDFTTGGVDPRGLALADVDVDGDTDVLVANAGSGDLAFLAMTTEGILTAPTLFDVGSAPTVVLAADVDGNASPDAVVLDPTNDTVAVLANEQVGTAFTSLGFGLAGVDGIPTLVGTGSLAGGSPTTLTLNEAAPSAPALLVIGLERADTPFKGGVLVPELDTLVPLVTAPDGTVALSGPFANGVPSATAFYVHCAIADDAAVLDVALSNALRGVTP